MVRCRDLTTSCKRTTLRVQHQYERHLDRVPSQSRKCRWVHTPMGKSFDVYFETELKVEYAIWSLVVIVVIVLDSLSLNMEEGGQDWTDERGYIAKHKHLEYRYQLRIPRVLATPYPELLFFKYRKYHWSSQFFPQHSKLCTKTRYVDGIVLWAKHMKASLFLVTWTLLSVHVDVLEDLKTHETNNVATKHTNLTCDTVVRD